MDARGESDALDAARHQRRGMRAALVALESAAASPAVDAVWHASVQARLVDLRQAFAHHVEVTERHDGLFAETMTLAPRLAKRVQVLQDDHHTIAAAINDTIAVAIDDADGATPADVVTSVRAAVTDLMGRITRHRQIGADLVYEAYNVDIEGGG